MTNWFDNLDWGSVPSWFEAVGTVGALLTGMAVLKHESDDRRRREEYERSAQARQIHVGPVVAGPAHGTRGVRAEREYSVTVHNRSDDAIHDLKILLSVGESHLVPGTPTTNS